MPDAGVMAGVAKRCRGRRLTALRGLDLADRLLHLEDCVLVSH